MCNLPTLIIHIIQMLSSSDFVIIFTNLNCCGHFKNRLENPNRNNNIAQHIAFFESVGKLLSAITFLSSKIKIPKWIWVDWRSKRQLNMSYKFNTITVKKELRFSIVLILKPISARKTFFNICFEKTLVVPKNVL